MKKGSHPVSYYEGLLEFATTHLHIETINAIIQADGVQKDAADRLGIDPKKLHQRIKGPQTLGLKRGYAPPSWNHPVPEGYQVKTHTTQYNQDGAVSGQSIKAEREGRQLGSDDPLTDGATVPPGQIVKGLSTLIDGSGQIRAQWVKTKSESEEEAVRLALESLSEHMEQYKGAASLLPENPPKEGYDQDCATLYPWGDPHIGMLAHHLETGEDFDIKIAEADCLKAVDRLVSRSERTETGVLINVGDFFHADDDKAVTPASGNRLDVDNRIAKVSRLGFSLIRRAATRMLEVHKHVIIFNTKGNHDPILSQMMSLWLSAVFENEPRVTVMESANPFMYWQFGRNLIGITHGDGPKPEQLPLIMVADQPELIGVTEYRLWVTGHIHHLTRKEFPGGFIVESFRTLAARDYWHHWKGYRSDRSMTSITLHREFGEIARATIGIRQVRAS